MRIILASLPISNFILYLLFLPGYAGAQQAMAESLWKEGVEFIKEDDYLRGLERMDDYLRLIPQDKGALANRAYCYLHLGDMQAACDNWNSAIAAGSTMLKLAYKYNCTNEVNLNYLKKYYYEDQELSPENAFRPKYTRADTLRGALRPERTCYDVLYYDLTVRIMPGKKYINGKNIIHFRWLKPSESLQIDLFRNLHLESILLKGTSLSFTREYDAVFVELPDNLQPGEEYSLEVFYQGKPHEAERPPWDGGFVWARDKRFFKWAGVACEHLGASVWWPNKDHLSDRVDSMAIRLEVPSRFDAVANGRLQKVDTLPNRYVRYNWLVDYPINNYNATFYMGKYTEFTDTLVWNDSALVMRYHVKPYNLGKAKTHFEQAKDVVLFFNHAFGPFPFWENDFRLVESPYEGMEHQTAIAYGSAYENDKNYVNKEFDYIIVHEAAHEWWGNSVAVADMADVWIHEGFATFSEFLFIEHKLGWEASVREMAGCFDQILNVYPLVQNRGVNENSFAGNDIYNKGAALLVSLRAAMNEDSLFFAMIRDFHLAYRDSMINSRTFIDFVNAYTSKDFTPLINKFLFDTEVPLLSHTYTHTKNGVQLHYRWVGVEEGFTMPFSVKLIGIEKSLRLEASTEEKNILLEGADSFRFYNSQTPTEGCPQNGFTYYATQLGR